MTNTQASHEQLTQSSTPEQLYLELPEARVVVVDQTPAGILGRGGYSEVRRAEVLSPSGERLAGSYAVKTLLGDSQGAIPLEDEMLLMQRAERVTVENGRPLGIPRALAHIIAPDGNEHMLMNRFSGGNKLNMLLARGMPSEQLFGVVDQVLETLSMLESDEVVAGDIGIQTRRIGPIIHHDVKPHNIYVDATGKAILHDFGIANGALAHTSNDEFAFGSPIWMAPEQCFGVMDEPKSDQFPLGVILLDGLVGSHTYASLRTSGDRSPVEQQYDTATGKYIKVVDLLLERHPEIPLEVQVIIRRAMNLRPEDRYESAQDMRDALQATGLVPPRSVLPVRQPELRGPFAHGAYSVIATSLIDKRALRSGLRRIYWQAAKHSASQALHACIKVCVPNRVTRPASH